MGSVPGEQGQTSVENSSQVATPGGADPNEDNSNCEYPNSKLDIGISDLFDAWGLGFLNLFLCGLCGSGGRSGLRFFQPVKISEQGFEGGFA